MLPQQAVAVQRAALIAACNFWGVSAGEIWLEMLAQGDALILVRRFDALAIEPAGLCRQAFIHEPAHHLAMLDHERHFERAHFEHRAGTAAACICMAKSGIEKTRVVHAEFSD